MQTLHTTPSGRIERESLGGSLFRTEPFFLIRTPLLPVELYQDLFAIMKQAPSAQLREEAIEHLAELSRDPVVREAIAVSSLSLLDSLKHLSDRENVRKRDQAVKGFLRYLIRMMTRPTPFGLFSGVACGGYAERGALRMQPTAFHRKRTRPDMQWLMKVIQQLEETESVVWQLEVQANQMIDQVGTRTRLPFANRYGVSGRMAETLSVRTTPVVEIALQAAAQFVPFSQVVDRIAQEYSDVPVDTIKRFLLQMFQQELLISRLRPPLTVSSPFAYVLECLEPIQGIEAIKQQLTDIAVQIAEYDRLPIGQGEALYRMIIQDMKRIADAKDLLQVDVAIGCEQATLPPSVATDVAEAAAVLWRLSPDGNGFSHLESYRRDFLERYGTAREVPLLELLDEDRGLGAPPTYEMPRSRRSQLSSAPETATQRDSLLMRWVADVQQRGGNELILTDEMVRQLEPVQPNPDKAPLSLELYFSLHAPSKQAMEESAYRLTIGANPGSMRAGKTFGRFADILGGEFPARVARVDEAERLLRPDAVFAEVIFQSTKGRHSNVCLAPHSRSYEISLGTNSMMEREETITLDDLLVGCTDSTLYLRSKRLGSVVIPTAGHMLNWRSAPNVYRFLIEIAHEEERRWQSFSWGALEVAPALPRVRYGRTILAPASWKLQRGVFDHDSSQVEWQEALDAWRQKWNVPRHVQVKVMDQHLLLDLAHPLHVDELRRDYQKLQDGGFLLLTETGGGLSEHCMESERGHHVVECVFPILRVAPATPFTGRKANFAPISDVERLHYPGGEWLYVKLYGMRSREDEFIGWNLQEFCRRVEEQELADLCFFMRYADPDPHIRLRFHGDPKRLWSELLPLVHEWAGALQRDGLLSKLVLDTYDPEIERYGGPDAIREAERLFAADSRVVAHWIGHLRSGTMKIDKDLLGVISVISLLEQFGLSEAEQVAELDRLISHKEYLDEFRQARKRYLQLADARNNWAGLREHADGGRIIESLGWRGPAMGRISEKVADCERGGRLYNTKRNILLSVIHLHLNRLFGLNGQQERKVMALTRHTLVQLQQKYRNDLGERG